MSKKTVKAHIMSHTWQSEQKSLLCMIEKAKMMNLDSANAERATIRNLRTIAPKAYQATFNREMPTTRVRRLISRLSRSMPLIVRINRQCVERNENTIKPLSGFCYSQLAKRETDFSYFLTVSVR